ncbi:MAG: hypothetical protein JJ902_15810 [Roseibium sp.]|nr:hypothetical protein [Roseibium sp.]
MKLFKGAFAALLMMVGATVSALAAGADVNTTVTGLALRGFDPVSYFTAGAPQSGDVNITAEYNGATYRFTTEANRDTFKSDPAKYAPQYGGFCAFGTAMGFKFDGDPHVWKIVDNKLYLNLSEGVQKRWNEDVPGFIATADTKWTDIKDTAPSDLQ